MSSLRRILNKAIGTRARHLKVGTPMRYNEGFREANIAHDLSWAFRDSGWYAFPEFPIRRGSIDALFVKNDQVVVCEWKRLYPRTIPKIKSQSTRMRKFDASAELKKYNFADRQWQISLLWVCDCWEPRLVNWWSQKASNIRTQFPFGDHWETGVHEFESLGKEWSPYFWTWAFIESNPSSR